MKSISWGNKVQMCLMYLRAIAAEVVMRAVLSLV